MHSRDRVAYGHGVPRITVISAADGDEIRLARMPGGKIVLYSHFHGHFNGYGAAVGIENLGHGRRSYLQQQSAEGSGRLMRKAAEHYMRHLVQLFFGGLVQHRMIVSVYGTPP